MSESKQPQQPDEPDWASEATAGWDSTAADQRIIEVGEDDLKSSSDPKPESDVPTPGSERVVRDTLSARPFDSSGSTSDDPLQNASTSIHATAASYGSEAEASEQQMSNFALICTGLGIGVTVFFVLAWGMVMAAQMKTGLPLLPLILPIDFVQMSMGIAAPALFALCFFVLMRKKAVWQKLIFIVVGLVLLMPWSVVLSYMANGMRG